MKRVVVFLLVLFSFLTAVFASEVSFVVSSNYKFYSYDSLELIEIPESGNIQINLTNNHDIKLIDASGNILDAKLVITDSDKTDFTFRWSLNAKDNLKLRYSLNDNKPKSIKSEKDEIIVKAVLSNTLTVFNLEAKYKKSDWYVCGRVGLIPVNVIKEKEEQPIIQEELIEPVVNENSSINTLEPKLISNAKANRKLILSSYFISSLQIISFESSTINNGMGVKASLTLPITNNFSLVLDSNYQWLKYFDKKYNELALMGKLRINSNINDSGIVFIQLGGGENFVSKANNKAYYPLVSTGLGLELYFTKSIALSFLGEYSISFQRDSINNHISGAVGMSIAFGKKAKV